MENIEEVRVSGLEHVATAASPEALREVRSALVGPKGIVAGLFKQLGAAPAADRKALGQVVNQLKEQWEAAIEEREKELLDAAAVLPDGFDVTRPGTSSTPGGLHPVIQVMYDLGRAEARARGAGGRAAGRVGQENAEHRPPRRAGFHRPERKVRISRSP